VCDLLAVARQADDGTGADVAPLPDGERPGPSHPPVVVHGKVVKVKGLTTAQFSSTWATEGDVGSRGPKGGERHEGTLVSTFTVTTTVSLPSPQKGLDDCERDVVQAAIDGPLSAHEDEHVAIFQEYGGEVRQDYDVKGGAKAVTAALKKTHKALDATRAKETRAKSKAIDPFEVAIDLSTCQPAPTQEDTP
jgi:hypothetical protein